jgi:hypothetical protein
MTRTIKISMSRGDTRTIPIIAKYPDTDTVINLTDATVWFTAKRSPADTDADAIFQLNSAGLGITIDDEENGLATATIDPADTSDLSATLYTLVYGVQVVESDGTVITTQSGPLIVSPDVTVSTSL